MPDTVVELIGDVLEVFTREATSGFMTATVTVMVVGAVLIAVSVLYGRVLALLEETDRRPGTPR